MRHVREPGQHRAPQPGRRRAEPPGKRRAEVRPRYGRIAVVTASAAVTGIAVLGGFGVLPSGPEDASAESLAPSALDVPRDAERDTQQQDRRDVRQQVRGEVAPSALRATVVRSEPVRPEEDAPEEAGPPPVPADSGSGRRVVFSESQQRVWLVDEAGVVVRSYLVSGSAYDNLEPGTFRVYSRSRHAVGIDDSGTMEYFVRFTHGDAGGAIGFHTIPVDDGAPVQSEQQLGTPLSHGCIRQRTSDAVALWDFAPLGSTVVVTG